MKIKRYNKTLDFPLKKILHNVFEEVEDEKSQKSVEEETDKSQEKSTRDLFEFIDEFLSV